MACSFTPGQGAITLYNDGFETYIDSGCTTLASDGYYGDAYVTSYWRVNGNVLTGPIAC